MTDAKFDPIDSADYVAPLQEGYKEINQGMNNFWDQNVNEYQRRAEIAGKDLQSLANMSETLGEYFSKKDEERRQADRAKGYMWMQENGIGPDQAMSFKEAEAKAREEGTIINEEIYNWERQGGDIWTSEAFRNMNASEKLGAVNAWAQMKAAQYNPKKVTEGATSYEDYNAALTAYRFEFYKQFGDINPAILNEYVFGTVRATDQRNYAEWYSIREKEIQTSRNEKYATELEACIRGGNGTSCIFNYQDSQAIHGWNKGKSTREGFKILKEMAKNGTLTKDLYVEILAENKEFDHKGRKDPVKFNEEFLEDLEEISDLIEKKELDEFNTGEATKKMTNSKEYTDLINSFDWTDYGLHKDQMKQLKDLKKKQERRYGFSHPMIDTALSGFGHKENYYKERKKELNDAILNGEVWSQEEAEAQGYELPVLMDSKIQELMKNVSNARYNYDTYAGYIENLVLSKAKVTNDTKSDEVAQIIDYLKLQLKKSMIAAAIADPDDKTIGNTIFQTIKNDFEADITKPNLKDSIFFRNGKWTSPQSMNAELTTVLDEENKETLLKLNGLINKGFEESVMVANTFFSPQQLMDYGEQYNKGSFVVPARANYIARMFNYKGPDGELLTGLDVINYQREAIDLEPLEKPNVLSNIEKLDDLSKEELLYNKTDASVNRVVGNNKEVVKELSTSLMHPLIVEYLKENSHQSHQKNPSLEGFWQRARLLENKLKEVFPDQKTHGLINQIKKQSNVLYKQESKEGGEIHGWSGVDKEQWRRQKYLDLLVENLGPENITEWVKELEAAKGITDEGTDEGTEEFVTDIDLTISMDFLQAYDFDFTNVPLDLDGGLSPFDQNRWFQLSYKHTGDIQFLENLKRPSFMNTNE
tara:strand:- start:2145 stop:4766 length:2622 start_codon:yes stop_codon:yes gene_type:complete